ncbi:MAG: hypothetical protein Q8Q10_01530 [bacterium]|nr:hypothetical protein [bacterium]
MLQQFSTAVGPLYWGRLGFLLREPPVEADFLGHRSEKLQSE